MFNIVRRRELIIILCVVIIIIGRFSLSLSFTQIYKATFVDGGIFDTIPFLAIRF